MRNISTSLRPWFNTLFDFVVKWFLPHVVHYDFTKYQIKTNTCLWIDSLFSQPGVIFPCVNILMKSHTNKMQQGILKISDKAKSAVLKNFVIHTSY